MSVSKLYTRLFYLFFFTFFMNLPLWTATILNRPEYKGENHCHRRYFLFVQMLKSSNSFCVCLVDRRFAGLLQVKCVFFCFFFCVCVSHSPSVGGLTATALSVDHYYGYSRHGCDWLMSYTHTRTWAHGQTYGGVRPVILSQGPSVCVCQTVRPVIYSV